LVHVEAHLVAQDAGVVDEDVEAAVRVDGLVDQRLRLRERRDAAVVGDGATTAGLDLVDHLLRRRGVGAGAFGRPAEVVHDDRGSLARQQQRLFAPDAAPRARDDRDLPVEQPHPLPRVVCDWCARDRRNRRFGAHQSESEIPDVCVRSPTVPAMPEETPIEEQLLVAVEGGGARVTINRPEAGNSLTAQMRDSLADIFDDLSADLHVRAVVLTGAGERHFCTGAGLGGPQKPGPARPADAPDRALGDVARMIRRGWQRLIASILDCEKPVIASVNGTAAGGGANLVLACDLVVMADSARLIEVFVRRGIIPDAGGCYLLPRIVGLPKAKEIMFFGDDLSAADAERIGIANRVVPRDDVMVVADEWARRLAASPSKAITMTKWLLNRSSETSRQTAFEEESYAQELVNATADSAEGMRAFMERRDPDFRGW